MSEAAQNTQPVFSIAKVYVKDLSLEIPNAPQAFLERETQRFRLFCFSFDSSQILRRLQR